MYESLKLKEQHPYTIPALHQMGAIGAYNFMRKPASGVMHRHNSQRTSYSKKLFLLRTCKCNLYNCIRPKQLQQDDCICVLYCAFLLQTVVGIGDRRILPVAFTATLSCWASAMQFWKVSKGVSNVQDLNVLSLHRVICPLHACGSSFL